MKISTDTQYTKPIPFAELETGKYFLRLSDMEYGEEQWDIWGKVFPVRDGQDALNAVCFGGDDRVELRTFPTQEKVIPIEIKEVLLKQFHLTPGAYEDKLEVEYAPLSETIPEGAANL